MKLPLTGRKTKRIRQTATRSPVNIVYDTVASWVISVDTNASQPARMKEHGHVHTNVLDRVNIYYTRWELASHTFSPITFVANFKASLIASLI